MRGIARRVVGISSMDVYRAWGVIHGVEHGPPEPLPITEDSALRMTRQLDPPETLKMMGVGFCWLDEDYDRIAVEEAIMAGRELAGSDGRLPRWHGRAD